MEQQKAKRITVLGEPAVFESECVLCGKYTAKGDTNTVTFRYLDAKGGPAMDRIFHTCSPEHQAAFKARLESEYPQPA